MATLHLSVPEQGGGGLEQRTAIAGSFSAWGGLRELDRGLRGASLFFLIPIATRPFKFHANSVSYTSSSFVSSFNSFAQNSVHTSPESKT